MFDLLPPPSIGSFRTCLWFLGIPSFIPGNPKLLFFALLRPFLITKTLAYPLPLSPLEYYT